MRKLTYFVAISIDGFIAGPGDEIDFYPEAPDMREWFVTEYPDVLPTHVRAQLGVDPPNRHFDTVVMGRATYEPALRVQITSPYAHLRQYVFSRSLTESPDPAVEIVAGDPLATVRRLKAADGAGIYLAGGGALAGALLPEIDELVIKLYPVVAGAGVPLFRTGFSPTRFDLTATRTFSQGALALTYTRKT